MDRYHKNPVQFLKTETAPDFVLAGSDGTPNDLAKTLAVYDRITPTTRSHENVTTRQYGSTGVATGIVTHKYTSQATGKPLSYRELFTYVFVSPKPGQWQLVSGQHTAAPLGTPAENEEAIKTVVIQTMKNAYALRQAEYEAALVDPASTFRASNHRAGYRETTAPASLTPAPDTKPREINPKAENMSIRYYGPNAAFVTYDQHLYEKPSKEIRLMERRNGQWKIGAAVTLWDYGQNQYEEANVRRVIDTETNAYHEGKGDLLKAQWSSKPYAERQQPVLLSALGVPFVKGTRLKSFANSFLKTHNATGYTAQIDDYDVHISGATAWATYTETLLDKTGKPVRSQREVKILEHEPGGWKIVFLGTQAMK